MSMEERSSASEWTKEQQVRYEDILKQETGRARHRAPPPSSKVVSINEPQTLSGKGQEKPRELTDPSDVGRVRRWKTTLN